SPSVTPAIHTTLGTGTFPATHAITGVPVLDDDRVAIDPFLDGESGRFMEVPAVAERWDQQTGNQALVGMIGHVPWHLGMIGIGAERPGGDRDHAAWLDPVTNEWVTNDAHYELPDALRDRSDLDRRLDELDRADGATDGMWRRAPVDDPARFEEVPAFTAHHAAKLVEVLDEEGYGADRVTDLMFTNFKQIDLLGHHFNMASPEVRDAIEATDAALAEISRFLEREVGHGNYVVVMTSDHGQQPSAAALDAYGIDSNELLADLVGEFGPVIQDVAPTEVFVDEAAAAERGVTVAEIARWLGDYRLGDNATTLWHQLTGSGDFSAADRVFTMAVPSRLIASTSCR
ncbi:MAG TPA: alkaline phosphatase family protein, partial [Actinomycetota bacterium]|nr:alkaline phosphatase family protein [Actinomycetota bacterium]